MVHKIQDWRISEENTLSDHNLILFSLGTNNNATPSNIAAGQQIRKFATQVGNWRFFSQKITQHAQKWDDHLSKTATKEQLDSGIKTIWGDLEEINKTCFPPFQTKSKYAPWWSPKLNTLRKLTNALKRRYKRCKNPVFRQTCSNRYKKHKNLHRTEIVRAKQDSWKKFCSENARSSPWKVHKLCKADFARN